MAHIQCGAAEPSSGAPQPEPGMSNADRAEPYALATVSERL
jgi:hypothetical protein